MSLSSMITLPSPSSNGFYSCWKDPPRVASPATSDSLSPPISPPRSPSLIFTLPAGSADGFYSSWKPRKEVASPNRSNSLSPSISRASSPLHTINEALGKRTSFPISHPLSERQNSESDSWPTSYTTSLSYAVRSINSRKSRLTVWYPRPVRPQRTSGVDVIVESAATSLESLLSLSSRPVSMSVSSQGTRKPVADKEHLADVLATLSTLFDPSPEASFPLVECRLAASWKWLLKIKTYEEKNCASCLRATRIFADSLLCAHNELVESDAVGAQELIRPCGGLNEAFENAYVLLSNSGTIPQAPGHISALDTDLFKNFVVSIMQFVELIRALEDLVDSLAILAVGASSLMRKADPDDDVIFNVPGWRQRKGSRPTLPSAAGAPEEAVDNTLRLLLVTWHEELEGELRGLRFLLWRAHPTAKVKLGNIVKLMLPLHHAELMKSPVEDFVVHWQAAVVPSSHGVDEPIMEGSDTDSC